MIHLKFLNGKQHLLDLIWLSSTLLVLYVHAGITRPGSLVDAMTTPPLAGLPEIVLADLLQFTEANPFRVHLHFLNNSGYATHIDNSSIIDTYFKLPWRRLHAGTK